MRFLAYIFIFLLPVFVQGKEWDIITIRNLYYRASTSKEDAEKFKTVLEAIHTPDECIKGYIAVCYMIEAKHIHNPSSKLNYFDKGRNLLDNAIKNNPDNIELKFLRICVQANTPFFLGYNKQIETDKAFILSKYSSISDLDLKKRIKEFINQSSICTPQEKNIYLK